MKTYNGSCHCGSVKYSFKSYEITSGLRCNCSICKRKGALMSAFTLAPDEIKITVLDGSLGLYQFGSKVAKHYFCQTCGIYPFHETVRMPEHYRVNLGCIEELDIENFESDVFDGKSL